MQIPRRGTQRPLSLYAELGLTGLPFPPVPVANPYSLDPRSNGAIYAEQSVRASIDKFEELLIRPADFNNRARLAYLWSAGDLETGRGTGKTALLRYFRQRINHDWGWTEFGGRFSALVVYVSFPSQVDRRYMEQLALSALVDICKSQVLDSARAVLRMGHLEEGLVQDIISKDDDTQDYANLLNDSILEANGVDGTELDGLTYERLVDQGIGKASANALATGTFEDYLRSFRRDGNLEPLYVPRDTKILEYSRALLFNDIVLYLLAADFEGGYLFIDDIENLVDQMPRRSRVEFAKEFALCTVRPAYANASHNFFSCVLTTHLQASVGLSAAWGEAGLASIARLDPNDPNSIELPLPSADQARQIVIAHLDYFREDPADKGSIKPFTEDGIETLVHNRQHPRTLLTAAEQVVSRAAREGISSINSAFVNSTNEGASPGAQDFTEGIDSAV